MVSRVGKNSPGDDDLHDLIRPLQDLVHSDISHVLLNRVILQVTVAAVHLESSIHNLEQIHLLADTPIFKRRNEVSYIETVVSGEELGHGAEGDGVGVAGVERVGRVPHHGAGRHQLGGHLGELELVVLEAGERLAELFPRALVVPRVLQARLGRSQRRRR